MIMKNRKFKSLWQNGELEHIETLKFSISYTELKNTIFS
jgi:hypothetical protein